MKISEISLGLRVTGTPKAAVICFYFIIKEISEVQVEVSKNKDADFSPSGVKDALESQWAPTPGLRTPGRDLRGQHCNPTGLSGEKGQRNRRLDRPTNRSE